MMNFTIDIKHFTLGSVMILFGVVLSFGQATVFSSPFSVLDYGAKGDGETDDSASVQSAIDRCAEAGGGTVLFPSGLYLCGSLHLRSHVTLYLDGSATIKGSPNDDDYDPYEELDFKNDADRETTFFHFSLLWGEDLEHVGIVGPGTIDSNRTKRGGPKSIGLKRCRHVEIRSITIRNSPNYAISLLGTDYVTIEGVTILNGYCDGIDPDSSRNIRISNCHIESYDDAIVPKASFSLGERRSSENITVTNCYLSTRCNGFKLGTESGGDFKRIAVSNCVISGLAGRGPATGGICLESVDGSHIEGVVVSNITMVDVRAPIFIRLGNRGRDMETPVPGTLKNAIISNVIATGASMPSTITGIPEHPVEGITLSNIRISYAGGPPFLPDGEEVPELIDRYPDPDMFPALSAYGFYCRHVKDLAFSGLHLSFEEGFWRIGTRVEREVEWNPGGGAPTPSNPGNPGHALVLEDVEDVRIEGLHSKPSREGDSLIHLTNVRNAIISGCRAAEGTGVFLQVDGQESCGIHLTGNDLRMAETETLLGGDAALEPCSR